MTTQLTFDVDSATKTRSGSEKTVDGVTLSRWSKHGNDRLYINGLFTSSTDVYVDLESETVVVSGTKVRSSGVVRDGDELTVTIERQSAEIDVQIVGSELSAVAAEDSDDSDESDGEVDLEELGIGL